MVRNAAANASDQGLPKATPALSPGFVRSAAGESRQLPGPRVERRAAYPKLVHLTLWLAALLSLNGCVSWVPVPHIGNEVSDGHRIRAEDLAFVRPNQTFKEELVGHLGDPWSTYDDLRVMVYFWTTADGIWLDVHDSATQPQGQEWRHIKSHTIDRIHYLFVELDGHGCVRRYGFVQASPSTPTRRLATKWLKHPIDDSQPTTAQR